ncbi:MAG: cell division protein FtsX [Gemmatimonas sp.]|jgi:cell division transport system permease protein|uniref:cell division protein FtsX n=1 Tax=Gemmatimonas sp. TaxID=1962908 RepID=UPI0022C3B24A|nr:permease-like cell division protein FtsX [Gemmatimonas sp.]MCA2982186.1 ABC transporter permease [Gemmatimonas sp.]MCA2986618.1 ABC transporter permease [Gemmatimonas sp.]MCA2995272.1 ABC transporter permease [Gemmatimonas sp.]MCE2952793.1 ABC transporter permease [Gemmatimonas sp.]MCZ8012003.1 permease-like cell division protein FtsX [Gemmatimonas sp.]
MKLALREVILAFRRAPLMAILGVVTIGFSLFAFGLFGLVALNIRTALREVEDRVEIRAFLVEGARDTQVEALMRRLQADPAVATVGYVSPDSALTRARAELAEFRDVLDGAFLPGSVELRLREGRRDPETVAALSRRLQTYAVVEDVRYGREWVEKLYRIRNIAALVGTVLGSVFALVAVIIIGSTIRMAILARTREIEIMRLVGATNMFVRLPYLIDGTLKGLLGGILAAILSYGTTVVLGRSLMQTQFFDARQLLLGILAGGLLGLIGSWGSVGRHLRQVWRD